MLLVRLEQVHFLGTETADTVEVLVDFPDQNVQAEHCKYNRGNGHSKIEDAFMRRLVIFDRRVLIDRLLLPFIQLLNTLQATHY